MSPFRVENFGLVWYNEKKDQEQYRLINRNLIGLLLLWKKNTKWSYLCYWSHWNTVLMLNRMDTTLLEEVIK